MRFNIRPALARSLPALLILTGLGLQPLLSQAATSWLNEIAALPVTTMAGTKPVSPSGLTGQYDGQGSVKLNWQDNATDETKQQVWMSRDGSSYSKITDLASNVTAYVHTLSSALSGTLYYTVRAINAYGVSGFSPVAKVLVSSTTSQPTTNTKPAAPSNLTGQADGEGGVKLAWKDNAGNETSQQVWMSTNGSSYSRLATLASNVTGYTHSLGNMSGAFYYTVRAVNAYGVSAFSPSAKVAISGGTTTQPPTTTTGTYVADVLNEVNKFRAQNGRTALKLNSLLNQAAQRHSNNMAANSTMSHNCEDGTTMVQRVNQAGYTWRALAENVAAGQSTPQQVVQAWANSSGHRANMLNTSVKDVGVGFNNKYWTLDLGG
jgi:uncharacterized protein YkwD